MDDDNSLSPENKVQDLLVKTDLVRQKLEIAEEKVMQLELSLLNSRDFAIGAAAELGEVQAETQKNLAIYMARYIESERQLGDANTHIQSHLGHIQRLENALVNALRDLPKTQKINQDLLQQIVNLRQSATWRIGRLIMLPIRILKKITK